MGLLTLKVTAEIRVCSHIAPVYSVFKTKGSTRYLFCAIDKTSHNMICLALSISPCYNNTASGPGHIGMCAITAGVENSI